MGILDALFGKPGQAVVPERYISNILTNRQLYKKAYLLEFYGEDGVSVEDTFTFSLPPESEELSYSQRKSETKTFGGLHVDDYGIDAVKIALSGSTVNQAMKLIRRPGQGDKWLTGEEEIYYLRDLLKKYKTGKANIKKKIILFDLSKSNRLLEFKGKLSKNVESKDLVEPGIIKNYWRVFPGEFKIRRASDRPFAYKYTIEFTGISEADGEEFNSHGKPPELSVGTLGLLQSMMNSLLEVLAFIDKINGYINDVLAMIDEVSNLINTLGNVMKYAASAIGNVMDSIGAAITGLMDSVTNLIDGVHTIIALPRTIQMKAVNIGLEVYNAAKRLADATGSLKKEWNDMFGEDKYWDIPPEVLERFGMTGAEFVDSIATMLEDAQDIADEIVTAAKSDEIPEVIAGNPDPQTGEQRLVLAFGYSTVILKSTDSLESLAAKYYGSPDNAIDVATYNGVASIDELEPGSAIKIPILQKTRRNSNNRIYARPGDCDNYGRDIALDDEGYLQASPGGDYKLADGAGNLSQAVLLRLRESVNKRVRQSAYGIRTNISDPTAGVAYILSSIDLTLRGEPRIKSVENIRFTGSGDNLNITVDYTDINNAGGTASGRA
jgi:hypothetical protein